MELISQLGLDWKLLLAQIVNFLILLFILGKFVYRPILAHLEHRSELIKEGIDNAERSKQKLEEIERMRDERMVQTQHEIGKLLDAARADAEQLKKEILATAQKQSDELLSRAKIQIQEEKEKMLQDVKAQVGSFIVDLTGKILHREITEKDQMRLAEAIAAEMKTV